MVEGLDCNLRCGVSTCLGGHLILNESSSGKKNWSKICAADDVAGARVGGSAKKMAAAGSGDAATAAGVCIWSGTGHGGSFSHPPPPSVHLNNDTQIQHTTPVVWHGVPPARARLLPATPSHRGVRAMGALSCCPHLPPPANTNS